MRPRICARLFVKLCCARCLLSSAGRLGWWGNLGMSTSVWSLAGSAVVSSCLQECSLSTRMRFVVAPVFLRQEEGAVARTTCTLPFVTDWDACPPSLQWWWWRWWTSSWSMTMHRQCTRYAFFLHVSTRGIDGVLHGPHQGWRIRKGSF